MSNEKQNEGNTPLSSTAINLSNKEMTNTGLTATATTTSTNVGIGDHIKIQQLFLHHLIQCPIYHH